MNVDLPRKIYQSRPDLILNIDNEYMTLSMMEQLSKFYQGSSVAMPQRHFLGRFVRDMRNWHENRIDYMHFTVPLVTPTPGYKFPSEFIGQYGVYEAVKHIYQNSSGLKHLVSDDGSELHVSKKFFSTDCEKGI